MKKIVILGAGLSGRGYLARQFREERYQLVFIDKDKELITRLREQGAYRVSFFEHKKEDIEISNYKAYELESQEAAKAVQSADYIFTCVGEQNLNDVGQYLNRILSREKIIIAAENGVGLSECLKGVIERDMCISECLMLCTTVKGKGSLDILSELMDSLPYRQEGLRQLLPFENFVPTKNYEALVKRKIYTYNCLSAAIAYLGAAKGYEVYSDAANDNGIKKFLDRLLFHLNDMIVKEYGTDEIEQMQFGYMARKKFENKYITDTIERNARDVKRKLKADERLMGPLNLMKKHGIPTTELETVIDAAILYGLKYKELDCDNRKQKENELLEKLNTLFIGEEDAG